MFAKIFRINGFNDTGADESGSTHLKINRIMNTYKKRRPKHKESMCIAANSVFKIFYFNRITIKNSKHRSTILWNEIMRVFKS